jgi:signal transduction histidine kinase/CheY-like chemotaxis protein
MVDSHGLTEAAMKSLKKTFRREIARRITATTFIAFAVIILAAGIRINQSLKAWEATVIGQAGELSTKILSEILVGNEASIPFVLRSYMANNDNLEARWSATDPGMEGLVFHFPNSWIYQTRVVSDDNKIFGGVIFIKHVNIAQLFLCTFGAEIFSVLLISGLLFVTMAPMANSIPNRFVLTPLQAILDQLQEYKNSGIVRKVSSEFEEVNTLIGKITLLMEEHQKFEELTRTADRNAAIAQTTQMLAHDVRKPFSLLRMGLTMLSNAKDPEGVKKVMSRIIPEIDKAMSSVDGMITDVMEVGSVSTNLIQEAASPESMIESTLGEIIRIYPEANISFTYEFNHTHMANVHIQKIGRVLSNIVGNSFQAMHNKGQMWFRTSERDGMIEFCLGNGGSVIPPDSLPKLFEAFFTSGKKGGTGLGLAIAQKIVTAHGGKIWCESSKTAAHPDGKVEFFFTLPIAGRVNQTTATLPRHSSDIAKQLVLLVDSHPASLSIDKGEMSLEEDVVLNFTATKRCLRVLIIDDEAIYRSALAAHLTRTPELTSALNITQLEGSLGALQAISKQPFDLIITDVDMGTTSLDGFELVKELRMAGSKALICVHSNRICAGDNKLAIEAGADSFMPKPMARAQLLRIVLQAAALAKISECENAPPCIATSGLKPGVLVIDDAELVIYAWDFMLGKDSNLTTMRSFEELQERLTEEPNFLESLSYVVTDMHLDGSHGNGLDVGRLIKSIRPDLPILMSSDEIFKEHELIGAVDKVIAKMAVGISDLRELAGLHGAR